MNKTINLIKELTYVDFKLKYYGSFLGFFWSLLKPLVMMGTLYFVFTYFLQTGIDQFAVFLLLGIILWNFFVDATNDSMKSIINRKDLITKTTLSPAILGFIACFHNFISFFLNFLIWILFAFIAGINFKITSLFFILVIILLILLSYSVSLVLIILNVRFTDFKHLWDVFLQIGFWITPIVYSLKYVPLPFQRLIMLNPLARIITHAREVLIYGVVPNIKQIYITFFIVLLIFFVCVIYYNKKHDMIVDAI